VKLDYAPLSLTGNYQSESKPELKDDIDSNLTLEEAADLNEQPSLDLSSTTERPQKQQSAAVVFVTTFCTIFLAEIGDKTQLSTLLMSAESHSPWVVFLGSAAALVTTSFLGVVLGNWIASRLSPKIVEKAAGTVLLLISVLLFCDVFLG
jgi:putative Ca2+/H+ antiporter (TMEM165/GDT1 family)